MANNNNTDAQQKLVENLIKRLGQLKTERQNWETHWDEVAGYFVPKKDQIFGQRTRGEKKHNLLFDSTSIHAAELLASALHGMLTTPTGIWFGLSTGDQALDTDDTIKEWLDDTSRRMIQVLNNSNFQTEIHEIYMDLVSFGTSPFRIEEDDETVVRFGSRPVYETYIAEDFKGRIDTVYYEYEMTKREIVNQFRNTLTEDYIRNAENTPFEREKILHAVEPRMGQPSKNKNIPKNMPFASYKILMCDHTLLLESGFKDNPWAVPRWSKISSEVYGRSPAMKALSDAKMLNKMKKATIEAAQLAVAPPLQVPDDGIILPVRTSPNSINYYRAGTKDRIEPLFTGSDVRLGEQMMATVKEQIRQAFFIDQLQLVQNSRMTTVEVTQRRDEQLRLLSPILGRLNNELLRPMIDRVFNIMLKKKMFLPPPTQLSNAGLQVQYTSMIAKAQLASEGENFQRALNMVAPVIQIQPEAADKFDGDSIVEYASSLYGLPTRLLRKDKAVQDIRQARVETQQKLEEQEDEMHDKEVAPEQQ